MRPHASTVLPTVYLLPRVLLQRNSVSTFVSRLLAAKWLVSMENTPLINVNLIVSNVIGIRY